MTDERKLTIDLINQALLPVSQKLGYCLCIHPMMDMINFAGLTCDWCKQRVTEDAYGLTAKAIRTEAVKAAYPWAVSE